MLNFLCSIGLAVCQTAWTPSGYQTQVTPDGYLLTNRQGVTFWLTAEYPGPVVPTHITVVRAPQSDITEVLYPPNTIWWAPNLHDKRSD